MKPFASNTPCVGGNLAYIIGVISMKPNRTSHLLRSSLKSLGSDIRVDASGFIVGDVSLPDTSLRTEVFGPMYAAYNIARKRAFTGTPPKDAFVTTLNKWADSEHRCAVVNRHGRYFSVLPDRKEVFNRLNQSVASNLSRLLSDCWPDFSDFQFTNGATNCAPRDRSQGFAKSSAMAIDNRDSCNFYKCVATAQDLLAEIFEQNQGLALRYYRARYKLLPFTPHEFLGTREECIELASWYCDDTPALLDYVPKDRTEVRLIAKSGALSIMIQKILGDRIRQALKAVGIDINDQTINQEWAEIGSLTGLVATIDLKSASDSIALRHLDFFPKIWRDLFMATRDKSLTVNSSKSKTTPHILQKVAGMGNGYIFELETALFWAMSLAVCTELGLDTSHVSVYGDDIIIPSAGTSLLCEYFLYQGFEINTSKSFTGKDPFRESCGKHYHNGRDVTPIYVKGDLNNSLELNHFINGLSDLQRRIGVDFSRTLQVALQCIPVNDRLLVPRSWDSKSGIYENFCDTIRLPTLGWSKNTQSSFVAFRYLAEVSHDILERFPIAAQMCASHSAHAEPSCTISSQTLRHKFGNIRVKPAIAYRVTVGKGLKQKRGAIPVEDAKGYFE